MESVLLVIHLIMALAIVVVVLIQPSESGGFMGSSSMSNTLAPRRSGDILSRLTIIFGAGLFLTSMLLAILASNRPAPENIFDLSADEKPAIMKQEAVKEDAPAAPEQPKAPISE